MKARKIIGCIAILLLLSFTASAVKNISLDQNSINESRVYDENFNGTFPIENNGNETLNLTLTEPTLTNNGRSVSIGLNQTTLNNFTENKVASILYSYNTGNKAGDYTGNVSITDSTGNINEELPFNITIQEFKNISVPDSLNKDVIINSTKTFSVPVQNTGNTNISVNTDASNTGDLSINTENLNINYGQTKNMNFSINTNSASIGTYNFNLSFTYDGNSKTLPVTVDVVENSSFIIENLNDNTILIQGEIDEKESKTVTILNNGDTTLHNFEYDNTDFESDDDDFNGNELDFNTDEGFNLVPDESKNLRFEIDIPDNIDLDTYESTLTITTDEIEKNFTIKLEVEGEATNINIKDYAKNVDDGILSMIGEPGEYITDDYSFEVENDGDYDARDLYFEVEDLQAEYSADEIPASRVYFSPSSIDVDENDEEEIDVEVDIPNEAPTGTYLGDIELYSSSGRKLDEITLEVKVRGDIYIREITIEDDEVKPGEELKVTVEVRNKGSKTYRNVKVYGEIFNIDSSDDDLEESSSTLILKAKDDKTVDLFFDIPDDAENGEKSLELRVSYDNQEIRELESIDIDREDHEVKIISSSIRPKTATCEETLYSYMNAENLGVNEEDMKFISEIEGTDIRKETSEASIDTDERFEKSLTIDISSLEPGNYNVINTVKYNSREETFETNLMVENCTENGIIDQPVKGNQSQQNMTGTPEGKKINIFGKEYDSITVYLAGGLAFVIILILIMLAFT